MIFNCDLCNKQIPETCTLYFGFDCLCCSNYCRSQIIKLNLEIDPTMNNPHTWFIHKLRERKTKQQPLIPKPKSLIELITQLQL
jgi:hypothetical protein